MIDLQPLNEPPGLLPHIWRNYPVAADHYTPGRGGYKVEYIVLHNTEGRDSRAYLSRTSGRPPDPPDRRVSIHKLVRRDGVYSIVSPANTAWHCGETVVGYSKMNFRSLGVEIESINSKGKLQEPYSDSDYNATAHTVAGWMFSYAIPWERVLRHAEIASPPGRRFDPSGLDMARLQRETYAWTRFFYALKVNERGNWII
jgi:N-acetyl-anhydromuramyl-L-alanine amidase AmpD